VRGIENYLRGRISRYDANKRITEETRSSRRIRRLEQDDNQRGGPIKFSEAAIND